MEVGIAFSIIAATGEVVNVFEEGQCSSSCRSRVTFVKVSLKAFPPAC